MKRMLYLSLLLGWLASPLYAEGAKSVRLVLPPKPGPVVENVGRVFARQIQQRCEAKVITVGDAPLTVELAIAPGIGVEGFRVEDRPGGVRIAGNDERGLLYGVGKFLRTSRYDQGGFTAGAWRGTSVPQKPIRGIYFATHFHNFYHDAPVEEVQQYVEDLGLWGYNTIAFWYDMHHFDGVDDPKAVAFRGRLHAICTTARRIGLDVVPGVIANEAYNNSPAQLRADPSAKRGGWYDCAVCPSKAGGMEYILSVLGGEFDWCADLQPRYVWIWPYDQGGCGCAQCRPWGSNGFLKAAESVASLARKKLPGTKIILSTWFFDEGEWQGLARVFAAKKPWADYILAEGTTRPMPAKLPMVGFPEISMHNTFPWGGFGATPLTGLVQGQWNRVKATSSGGFPYSEGIYEDLTKVVISQFYWNDQPAAETVKEYIAYDPETRSGAFGHACRADSGHDGRSAMMYRRLSRRHSRLIAAYCARHPAISPPHRPCLRRTIVVTKQPAQTLAAANLPRRLPDRLPWLNQLVAQALVIPFFVVVGDELFHGAPQLALTEEDHLGQTFRFYRSHESLGVRIQIGTSRR